MSDIERLAELIAADLRVADEETEEALEARRRIASEYQALDREGRARLDALLGAEPAPAEPKASRETETLMRDLKQRRSPSPSPAPRPKRIPKRAVDYADPPERGISIITRLTFRRHPFVAHRWPYSNATWCQICGETEARHEE